MISRRFRTNRGAYVNLSSDTGSVLLPKSLIGFIRDKSTRDRVRAAFKLVANDSKVSGEKIQKKALEIRKRFIHHHLTTLGNATQSQPDVVWLSMSKGPPQNMARCPRSPSFCGTLEKKIGFILDKWRMKDE
jgi:hypothetical protein